MYSILKIHIILQTPPHVSVPLHHFQGALNIAFGKVIKYGIIKITEHQIAVR